MRTAAPPHLTLSGPLSTPIPASSRPSIRTPCCLKLSVQFPSINAYTSSLISSAQEVLYAYACLQRPGGCFASPRGPQRLAHLIGRFGRLGSLDDTRCSWLPDPDHLLTCRYTELINTNGTNNGLCGYDIFFRVLKAVTKANLFP